MNKSKNSSEEPEADRLSDLPDSLIFEIFWSLPMRDVVRTTILSKRWDNLWTTAPYLDFHDHAPEFVNRVLKLWNGNGCRILKFKFGYDRDYNHSSVVYNEADVISDIDVWMRLAKDNGVEELYLDNLGYVLLPHLDLEDYSVPAPHNMYSCSSLKVLSLKGCSFENHNHGNGNLQWNQLKSLTIGGFLIDQNLIDKVMSGCPQLEVFILDIWDSLGDLSIRSTSLKKLSIDTLEFSHDEPSPVSELRIWSPNLETLYFSGIPFAKWMLMDVSSLTHLTLIFSPPHHTNFVGEKIMGQILPAIQHHVEKLSLSFWCTEGILAMKEKYLLSPLSNINFLDIYFSHVKYKEIVDLLQIFPKLETLVFYACYEKDVITNLLQVERNLPESFLLQLRTVEIICDEEEDCDCAFPFIEMILLKRASKLQKMVLIMPSEFSCLALQKILKMPRSSQSVEFIVDD